MNKIFTWFGRNRKTIGYTIGGINVLLGLSSFAVGNIFDGFVFLSMGSIILLDAKVFN